MEPQRNRREGAQGEMMIRWSQNSDLVDRILLKGRWEDRSKRSRLSKVTQYFLRRCSVILPHWGRVHGKLAPMEKPL